MKKSRVIDYEFFYGAPPEIFFRASQLRNNMTRSEMLLWEKLRRKKIYGLTFRRQHPINLFIADFYCHKAKLVIEVDGSLHEIESYKTRDKGRDDEFEKFGLITIRFSNDDIIYDIDSVIKKIKEVCSKRIMDALP
jgi:very-short-patch-repair endonuclease